MKTINLLKLLIMIAMLTNTFGELVAWDRTYPGDENSIARAQRAPSKRRKTARPKNLFADHEIETVEGWKHEEEKPILGQDYGASCGFISAAMILMDLTQNYQQIRGNVKEVCFANHIMYNLYFLGCTNISCIYAGFICYCQLGKV